MHLQEICQIMGWKGLKCKENRDRNINIYSPAKGSTIEFYEAKKRTHELINCRLSGRRSARRGCFQPASFHSASAKSMCLRLCVSLRRVVPAWIGLTWRGVHLQQARAGHSPLRTWAARKAAEAGAKIVHTVPYRRGWCQQVWPTLASYMIDVITYVYVYMCCLS